MRLSYPAGWRFSTDMGQAQCYDTHVGYMISDHIHGEVSDGAELDLRAGDVLIIPPGHDAWTVGDETAALVQFDEGASALSRFAVEAPSARTKAA